jgi:hypothetical protein
VRASLAILRGLVFYLKLGSQKALDSSEQEVIRVCFVSKADIEFIIWLN